MHLDRLNRYLRGGTPPGGLRAHPGCRDPRPPIRSAPVTLPGVLYFATESAVWTGGRAFLDTGVPEVDTGVPGVPGVPGVDTGASGAPGAPGVAFAHAHLLTAGQFADIAAQEMGREPGVDLDLSRVLGAGRDRLGPGRYETLVLAGWRDGFPLLTFTAPWRRRDVPGNAPSAAYLRHLGAGLIAAHGWDAARAAAYLASRPGAAGHWSAASVETLLRGGP
ncbi:histone deacetylase [Streptomyces sp. NBC_01803]|uniref:histone deacetylase n=1 Tax=Streptomyces sp. NBC_01803 TaxID=2975946 RepID=UPI002DDC23CE|nr:histone deacetylase [Streptomyces sp. NBC_01803]WSA45570.1 histone deacetylase [Streptomyces sp. NBC_01803]